MFERGSLVNFALLLQVDQPLVSEAAAKGCCVRPTLPFYKILFTHLHIVQIKSFSTIYFHDVANFFWGTCFRPSHTSPPASVCVICDRSVIVPGPLINLPALRPSQRWKLDLRWRQSEIDQNFEIRLYRTLEVKTNIIFVHNSRQPSLSIILNAFNNIFFHDNNDKKFQGYHI